MGEESPGCTCGEGPHGYVPDTSAEAHACLRRIAVQKQSWSLHETVDREAAAMQRERGVAYFLETKTDIATETMKKVADGPDSPDA